MAAPDEFDPKIEPEQRKLLLEIRELSRPWWQKPAYLSAILPSVLALATVLVIYQTGYLRNESTLNEIKRQQLLRDISDFQMKKDTLERSNSELKAQQDALKSENEQLKVAKEQLADEAARLTAMRKQLAGQVQGLVAERTAIQEKLDVEEIRTHLDVLRRIEPKALQVSLPSVKQIIGSLAQDGRGQDRKVRYLVEQTSQVQTISALRALVYFMLFSGTGDGQWRTRLQQLAQNEGEHSVNSQTPVFMHLMRAYVFLVQRRGFYTCEPFTVV